MKENRIELGSKVKCKITGYEGVAIARIEFINGCIQYEIAPRVKKGEQKYPDSIGIDQNSLEIMPTKKKKIKKKPTGGAVTTGIAMRGY